MRPPLGVPALSRRARVIIGVVIAVIVLIIALGSLSNVYIDWLWFGSVGYRGVFSSIMRIRVALFFVVGVLMAAIVVANIAIAYRTRPLFHPMSSEQHGLERYRSAVEPHRRLILIAVAALIGIFTGVSAQGRWQTWLLWRNGTPFGVKDPQFHKDVSFYTFTYPFERMVLNYLFVAVVLAFFGALIVHYLFGGLRISTPGEKVLPAARAHLSVLLGAFVLLKAVAYFLDRYGLVFSDRGGTTGASYTDVNAVLPTKAILMFVALICAIAFVANAFFRNFALPAIALVLLVFSSLVIGAAYPAIVQQFSVKPNANEKEAPYIQRNIDATRAAYGISDVDYQVYDAKNSVDAEAEADIKSDTGTIPNARLLDPNVLAPTFDQLQRILNYYGFADKLDIDRYTDADGQERDYVIGVRELDPSKLTGNQTNWINQHLVYTHGNGFVAAPANTTASDGAPDFTTGGLPTTGSIEVSQGDIYYGEMFGDDYSIVGVKPGQAPREFDLPGQGSGSDVKTTYAGTGGVKMSNFLNRLVFAVKYRERNILFSSAVSSESKILFDRDPRQMVQKVAPFLKVDGDPYPVVIDGKIEWIVDCYTTSDGYPYSERETLGDITKDSLTGRGTSGQPNQQVNYIRNSVKATVDAYNGTVTLYAFDPSDPVLQTWMKAFPGLFQTKISDELRSHFRYPEDLFKVQRDLIASYHVNDPGQFFNSQNFWEVPPDPTQPGDQPLPPYYIVAQAPGQTKPTFQLTTVLNALQRPNMAAYVTVSSDPDDYGKFTVYTLPGDSSVSGPKQAYAQFNSDTDIAQSIALLDKAQSNVVYGNLLTLPVAGGLLYVEPLYVQGSGSAYPLLRKVMVSFGSQIGYGDTLQDALKDMFASPATTGNGDEGDGSDGGASPSGSASPTNTPSSTPSSTAPSTSAPTSSAPPTTSPPTTAPSAPPTGQTLAPGVTKAVADINKAIEDLKKAWASQDPVAIGKAQAELQKATEEFEKANGQSSASGGG
jgi:uncharacterized membrane protein (UPF0182 family)